MGEDVLYDFQEISLNIGYSEDLKHDICLISSQTIAQKRKSTDCFINPQPGYRSWLKNTFHEFYTINANVCTAITLWIVIPTFFLSLIMEQKNRLSSIFKFAFFT